MPNWCSNFVQVSHPDRSKMVMLRRRFRQGQLLDHLCPTPKHLIDTMSGYTNDPYEKELLEFRQQLNIKYYGFKDWWDFRVAQWGTKWDVGERGGDEVVDANSLTLSFESAWSPPTPVYERMIEEGYEVVAYYYEPGMAFVGKWDNGIDDCFQYNDEKSTTVRSVIGDELDDMFGISESMAEYEAENEEELTAWIKDGEQKRKEARVVEEE